MEKNYFKDFMRKQEEQRKELKYLEGKEKQYRTIAKQGKLPLTINWLTDFANIDLTKLKTSLEIPGFPVDYEILWANTDLICAAMGKGIGKVYPKDNLWFKRQPHDTVRVLDFIEKGNAVIPLIFAIPKDSIIVIDGNHRFAICRYLELEEIPFIIDKKSIANLNVIKVEYWKL